ncbi:MAG TPA: DUF1800 domain-containing protein [Candidatus Tectomicrobia bacterium]|jgi:uncharacterized protein (DUF1800 family)
MPLTDLQLMAHLFRRAGFGATRDELEAALHKGYEATVEELLHPENAPDVAEDLLERYYLDAKESFQLDGAQIGWVYRMINTKRPLEEKMTLFWHGLFATGFNKCDDPRVITKQIRMFRRHGLGNFRELLVELSRDPAMIYWLDNNQSRGDAPNENYGRELLELFSMGIGNYSEDDVKAAARAFTGWTLAPTLPRQPYGRFDWEFEYRPELHDDSTKTFLGETGRWNGEDIVNIVVKQPAAARFIARHLYNFFVADEPQVPAWPTVPPRDPAAIDTLMDAYMTSQYDMRAVLRTLFLSDFFRSEQAYFAKVKSPTELVIGTVRLTKDFRFPRLGLREISLECRYMGQDLLNPPSVEGWHTGKEWIDTGCLVERINFAAQQVSDVRKPGVRLIVDRVRAASPLSPERFVDTCLELTGPVRLRPHTRAALIDHVRPGGELRFDAGEEQAATQRVSELLQLIVATREYQLN